MAKKQTSAKISSIAGRYMAMTTDELVAWVNRNPEQASLEIRMLAASAVSQDEIGKQN